MTRSKSIRAAIAAPLVLASLASICSAQGFNLNVQDPTQTPPPSTYGALSDQEGLWNPLYPGMTQTPISDIHGTLPSVVQVTFSSSLNVGSQLIPSANASRVIFDNFVRGVPNVQAQFDGLEPGTYSVIAYAWVPDGVSPVYISVGGNQPGSAGTIVNGSTFPDPEFHVGRASGTPGDGHRENYWGEVVDIAAGESLYVTVLCDGVLGPDGKVVFDDPDPGTFKGGSGGTDLPLSTCSLAAIQIIPLVGTAGCSPAEANSVGSTPELGATGTLNPDGSLSRSANDLVLSAGIIQGGLPVSRPILVFVSNLTNPGAPFGCSPNLTNTDSMRCIGPGGAGGVERILSPNTIISPSGFYSIPVDLNLLPASISTGVGAKLHFQMVYWDVTLPGDNCFSVQGTPRWTSRRSIVVGL